MRERLPARPEFFRAHRARSGVMGTGAHRPGRRRSGAEPAADLLPGSLASDRGLGNPRRRRRLRLRPAGHPLHDLGPRARGRAAGLQRRGGGAPVKVRQLVPASREIEAQALANELEAARYKAVPFAPELLALADELSQGLLRDSEARRWPELQALGFWMRRAELERLKKDFSALARPGTRLAP